MVNSFTLNLFYKIKSSCPRFLLGQERIRSCGTTQIDANCVHSAHTSNNARSPDNGRSPRRSYSGGTPFRLALVKSIPQGPCLPQSHRLRLSWRFGLPATRLRHCFSVWSQYILTRRVCQVYFENFYKLLWRYFLIVIVLYSLESSSGPPVSSSRRFCPSGSSFSSMARTRPLSSP